MSAFVQASPFTALIIAFVLGAWFGVGVLALFAVGRR